MDPVCHTLFGAALAESGLKRTTALGAATLIIGANAPDIDAITYVLGDTLLWRRGWSHGVLALVAWPFILTAVMLLWDRLVRRRGRGGGREPARPAAIFGLAALGVASHPTLDWMNTYGMRWLMPFDGTWFYGDTLFIIDPWMWAALGLGVLASRHMARRPGRSAAEVSRPARVGLCATVVYVVAMLALTADARALVARDLATRGFDPTPQFMAGPVFASPFTREVIVDLGTGYLVGAVNILDRAVWFHERLRPDGSGHPAIEIASRAPEARGIVNWLRFPLYSVEERGDAWLVRIDDARYAPPAQASWAAVELVVPKPVSSTEREVVKPRPGS